MQWFYFGMVIIIQNKQRNAIFGEARLFPTELSKSLNYFVEKHWKKYWKTHHFGNFFSPFYFGTVITPRYVFFLLYAGRPPLSVITNKVQCIMMNLSQPKWFFDCVISYHDFLQKSRIGGLCYFNQIEKMDSVCMQCRHRHICMYL